MSQARKSIRDLDLIDDFLFMEASADDQTSQLLIRLIIERASGLKVGKLIIEPQKTVNGVDTDCHGICMDLSIKEVRDEDGKTKTSTKENAVDDDLKMLHESVDRLKRSRKVGVNYMSLYEMIKYRVSQEAKEVAQDMAKDMAQNMVLEQEQRMVRLTGLLLEQERYDDLKRITQDEAYRKELLEKME